MDYEDNREFILGYVAGSKIDLPITITGKDRQNIGILGGSWNEKTTIIKDLVMKDIENKTCVLLVNQCHNFVLPMIQKSERDKIIFVSHRLVDEHGRSIRFNPLETRIRGGKYEKALKCMHALIDCFPEIWGVWREELKSEIVNLIMNTPNSVKFLDIMKALVDDDMRKNILKKCTEPTVKTFWEEEFLMMQRQTRLRSDEFSKMINSPLVNALFDTEKSSVSIREIIDDGKIVVVDLGSSGSSEVNAFIIALLIAMFDSEKFIGKNAFDSMQFNTYVDDVDMLSSYMILYLLCKMPDMKITVTASSSCVNKYSITILRAFCKHLIMFKFDSCDLKQPSLGDIKNIEDMVKLNANEFGLFFKKNMQDNEPHILQIKGVVKMKHS